MNSLELLNSTAFYKDSTDGVVSGIRCNIFFPSYPHPPYYPLHTRAHTLLSHNCSILIPPILHPSSRVCISVAFTVHVRCNTDALSAGGATPYTQQTPFNAGWGVVPNKHGRVEGSPGLYASGWIKTGPTGVIATTMNNGFETAGLWQRVHRFAYIYFSRHCCNSSGHALRVAGCMLPLNDDVLTTSPLQAPSWLTWHRAPYQRTPRQSPGRLPPC